MKKLIALLLALVLCLSMAACGKPVYGHSTKASILEKHGVEMFQANDLDDYLQTFENCELSDLKAEPHFAYDFERDYKKDKNTLYLKCYLSFTSDEIGAYYTTHYHTAEADALYRILRGIDKAYVKKSYEYPYETEGFTGKVVVTVARNNSQFNVETSDQHEYRYTESSTGTKYVYVDDDSVYMEVKGGSSSGKSFTNKFGTSTTKCVYSGCSNYIASSGDTNCCTTHSNRCGNCSCYIDGDAMFCMTCLTNALTK